MTMTARTEAHITRSEDDTLELAAKLARQWRPGTVIAIDGNLGAGKTAFVRGLVQGLQGESSDVSSPTFVISQEYDTPSSPVIHIDAYRIGSVSDLESIGWDEMLTARDAIIAIEWAERIEQALPDDAVHITIDYVDEEPTHRAITVTRKNVRMLTCPICKELAPADSQFAPFCSQRCRRADLGRWLKGEYKFSRPVSESDIESQD